MTEEPYLDPKRYVTWRALGTIIVVLWALQFGITYVTNATPDIGAKFGDVEAAIEAATAEKADEQTSDKEAE